jgi:hypothetical protein
MLKSLLSAQTFAGDRVLKRHHGDKVEKIRDRDSIERDETMMIAGEQRSNLHTDKPIGSKENKIEIGTTEVT